MRVTVDVIIKHNTRTYKERRQGDANQPLLRCFVSSVLSLVGSKALLTYDVNTERVHRLSYVQAVCTDTSFIHRRVLQTSHHYMHVT